jgi:hypothetical protein
MAIIAGKGAWVKQWWLVATRFSSRNVGSFVVSLHIWTTTVTVSTAGVGANQRTTTAPWCLLFDMTHAHQA